MVGAEDSVRYRSRIAMRVATSRTKTIGPPNPNQNQGLMGSGLMIQFPNCQSIQAPIAAHSRRLNSLDVFDLSIILAAPTSRRMSADVSFRNESGPDRRLTLVSGHCR